MEPTTKRNLTNPVLVILLVAAAFTIGMFWQRIQSLEKTAKGTGTTGTVAGTEKDAEAQPAQPDPKVLAKNAAPVSDQDHVRGDKNAAITWIEYSDLECPFCAKIHPDLVKLMDEYKGKVRWVYRHFPLDQLHPHAREMAEASECAAELGGNDKFWSYIDELYEATGDTAYDKAVLGTTAQKVGLNKASFDTCLASGKHKDKIQSQYDDGLNAGISGTPGNIVINKDGEIQVLSGAYPYAQMKAAIDELL